MADIEKAQRIDSLFERFGGDWSYDTLKRCRQFYQAYLHAQIGATRCSN